MRVKKALVLFLSFCLALSLTACNQGDGDSVSAKSTSKKMLFYIGITMVRPVSILAERFEQLHTDENLEIVIVQGGSQDLYNSITSSQQGDLYLPGALSYRKNNVHEGFLTDFQFVGYNRAAIVVRKGNPKNIPANLGIFTSRDVRSILCNPESGSIGQETKNVLTEFGNCQEAFANAAFLSTDSRKLNKELRDDNADVTINWRATAFWDDNSKYLDVLPIDETYAKKKMLVFNLLSTSKYPELARQFMAYAASEGGRRVFYTYGFLNDADLENFDKVIVE
ncbi:substrate-binding domain-containing protein [Desulforhopalus vacuolatus]|uniref:substrate-binding domain-containing protein n=1 Tax=Desulforhopalus vacuolatus TaxID=40414 RepID=UPI001963D45F|nr:substrate-binding domain-containing protein [Desulforhopalus vacuolatus]MBM9521195.1 substrate-binding domain-containing protein [Desulforhopalus vacuolatus]